MIEGAKSQWMSWPQEAGKNETSGFSFSIQKGRKPYIFIDFSPVRPMLDY